MSDKLTQASGSLQTMWQDYRSLWRADLSWFRAYPVLEALVTQDVGAQQAVCRVMEQMVDLLSQAYSSNDPQYHTHTLSAPLGRWAIYYDWLAENPPWSEALGKAFREALMQLTYDFSAQQLCGRVRRFDNQVLSNALAALAVGYVFGVRRGDDAVARRLFDLGLAWSWELLAQLPSEGYSTEGSTYQEHVVFPMVAWSALLLEEVTKVPVMRQGVPPHGAPALAVLQTTAKLIGPDGLLPPWDDYGYQHASVKAPLALLAQLTDEVQPLALIQSFDLWHRHTLPAWEVDDRLWTLLWWPRTLTGELPKPQFKPWMLKHTGAALQLAEPPLRVFQCWDACGAFAEAGRLNVDPNGLSLHFAGSPILMDGHGLIPADQLARPKSAVFEHAGLEHVQTLRTYLGGDQAASIPDELVLDRLVAGSVGHSNALVIDGEGWYAPPTVCWGSGQALHHVGPVQVMRSDATAFYVSRYDVHEVTRSTMLIGQSLVLISDYVSAASAHRVTWQAFVRNGAIAQGDHVSVRTPEHIICDIIPLQAGELRTTKLETYPRSPDSGSVRMEHEPVSARTQRMDVAMLPRLGRQFVADLSEGWHRVAQAITPDESVCLRIDAPRGVDATAMQATVLQRTLTIPDLEADDYLLEIRSAPPGTLLRVNGHEVLPTVCQQRGLWKQSLTDLPWFFDLHGSLHQGDNQLEIQAPNFHGETLRGPVWLHRRVEPIAIHIHREGEGAFVLHEPHQVSHILCDNRQGICDWHNGRTDARYAVATAQTITAVDVTRYQQTTGLNFESQAPCAWHWSQGRLELIGFALGNAARFQAPGVNLHITLAGYLHVNWYGLANHVLAIRLPMAVMVEVNGQALGMRGPTHADDYELIPLPACAPDEAPDLITPHNPQQVIALEHSLGPRCGSVLIQAVLHADWRTQVAAADALGRLHITEACDVLRQQLLRELAEGDAPPLSKWWSWGRMLTDRRDDGPDPTLPRPLGEKRWRFKRALITALGRLGDRQAVAMLEKLLDQGHEYFCVNSQLVVALGRLGSPSSIPIIAKHTHNAEVNTRIHALLALDLLQGKITLSEFESQVAIT